MEVLVSGGLPKVSLVGLPATAVRESKDRVRAALHNTGFRFPPAHVTVSLAPADLPKEGSRFDLPIALGILAASGQVTDAPLKQFEFLREVALAGRSRQFTADSLSAVVAWLLGRGDLKAARHYECKSETCYGDLADVHGQHRARRALEIAAAGGHNLLFRGPPGTGKTMLAARLPAILPPLSQQEALEAAAVASVSRPGLDISRWKTRAFRAPHHSASSIALVGGGSSPGPGEISLAHHGVLFLDELPEFRRDVLEMLREPMESGRIIISRAARQAEFPARFQLVAARNPYPCGYHGDRSGRCHCSAEQIQRYRGKISGPLLDRIDLHVEVSRPRDLPILNGVSAGESSAVVRERVLAAHRLQLLRADVPNALLDHAGVGEFCALDPQGRAFLEDAAERMDLSPRAVHRVLKVARTLADLEASDLIRHQHLAEALSYRGLDTTGLP